MRQSVRRRPSMKVPPKRKGNHSLQAPPRSLTVSALNESPSEKEGKYTKEAPATLQTEALNESPSEKEGK